MMLRQSEAKFNSIPTIIFKSIPCYGLVKFVLGEGESRLPIYQPAFQCTQRTTFLKFVCFIIVMYGINVSFKRDLKVLSQSWQVCFTLFLSLRMKRGAT